MTPEAFVAVCAGLAALGGTVAFVLSLRPSFVVGPPWQGTLVGGGIAGAWALTWFGAAVAPPATGAYQTVVVTMVVVAAVLGGGPVSTAVIRLADSRPDVPVSVTASPPPGHEDRGEAVDGRPQPPEPGPATPDLLKGGALIGVLERAGIVASLLVGFEEGVAVVLAVKGLGRFGELRAPAAPERFIVGTLASVVWAIAGFGLVRAVLA